MISDQEKKILEFIAIYGRASNRQLHLSLNLSLMTVRRLTKKMMEQSLLKLFNKKYIIGAPGLEIINLLKAKI